MLTLLRLRRRLPRLLQAALTPPANAVLVSVLDFRMVLVRKLSMVAVLRTVSVYTFVEDAGRQGMALVIRSAPKPVGLQRQPTPIGAGAAAGAREAASGGELPSSHPIC